MEAISSLLLLISMFAGDATGQAPGEPPQGAWVCRNQVEVWCGGEGCAASPADEFTPMSVSADVAAGFSACAYTGCWRSDAAATAVNGRLLWSGDDLAFSTAPDGGMNADATLLIIEKDGVGFVRAGGLATPLLCERAAPAPADTDG